MKTCLTPSHSLCFYPLLQECHNSVVTFGCCSLLICAILTYLILMIRTSGIPNYKDMWWLCLSAFCFYCSAQVQLWKKWQNNGLFSSIFIFWHVGHFWTNLSSFTTAHIKKGYFKIKRIGYYWDNHP